MKKTLIIIAMVLGTVCCTWAGKPSEVSALARQYGSKDGFEVVSMGRVLISALGVAASMDKDLDAEDRAALNAFKGIKKLTVVDFEDASEADKTAFCAKLDSVLEKMELILEAKEDGDVVKIYGYDDGTSLHDIVIYCPDEAVICVNGSIALENIGKLMEVAQ